MIFTNFFIGVLAVLWIEEIICAEMVEKKYDNYTLYRGTPTSELQLSFLQNLSSLYDANYWRGPSDYLYRPVEFLIGPEKKKEFLKAADQYHVYLTTVREDIQRAFDLQTVKSYIRRNMESFNWHSYYRLKDIYNWLHDLGKMNPKVMQVQSIGKTHLGNDILMVRIALKGSKMRSRVIIEGGIHAREWIAPAFVTYFIYQILHAPHSKDMTLRTIAETYEWFFVPVLNPDGYEYSHTKNRLWRKNNHGHGVDINRNFGVAFGTVGVSREPHSDIYCGAKEFSELESSAMAKFVQSKSKNLEYYLAFHSYGQYMILPYTHSKKHQDNFDDMKMICDQAAAEIYRRHKTHYTVGTAYDTVGYMTSGVSCCWAKKKFNIPYVVTFELRDSGDYGFALPAKQILPTCEETMDGVLSLLSPRSKLKGDEKLKGSQQKTFLDVFVILWNVVLFIIISNNSQSSCKMLNYPELRSYYLAWFHSLYLQELSCSRNT